MPKIAKFGVLVSNSGELDKAVTEPAQLSARLAARVSRAMYGRKVDVLIKAPNLLLQPIHAIALAEGIRL
jgi:hypothetical protein